MNAATKAPKVISPFAIPPVALAQLQSAGKILQYEDGSIEVQFKNKPLAKFTVIGGWVLL